MKIDTDILKTIIEQGSQLEDEMQASTDNINEATRFIAKKLEKEKQEKIAREEKKIGLLESIDNNTKVLSELLIIARENNEYQKEILEFMKELIEVAMMEDKVEATSKYREIMNKAKLAISDFNVVTTVLGYGLIFGEALKAAQVIN